MEESPKDRILIHLDLLLVKRKMTLRELAEALDADYNALSIFKLGKGKAVKLDTLMRMCKILDCTPNDLISFEYNEEPGDLVYSAEPA